MNKRLEKLVNGLKINKDDLSVDITKDEFTFKEIYALSLELKVSLRDLFSTMVLSDLFYSAKSLIKGIENGEFDKVKKTILSGYVFNCNDKLYFTNRKYRIVEKDCLPEDVAMKLFELLIKNDEWDMARRLSSKGLYYKFTTLDDKNIKYLLGDINEDILSPDYYAAEIYKLLDDESKKTVKDLMMMHYVYIVLAYKEAKNEGLKIEFISENSFTVSKKIGDDEYEYRIYLIDDLYKEFDKESQEIVIRLLKEIR